MKKRILMIGMALMLSATPATVSAKETQYVPASIEHHYDAVIKHKLKGKRVYIYESKDVTYKTLTHRKGKYIVERIVGKCTDNKGNGVVLNCADENYNYISYRKTKAKKGDVIVTYCVYNPNNNVEDDILYRYDFIVRK